MEYRGSENDPPMTISFYEFRDLVRRGEVPPTALYWTPWGREWRTVDNVPAFHRHSPVKYPVGPWLANEPAIEEAQRESAKKADRSRTLLRRQIIKAYGLRQLPVIARDPGIQGASRLIIRGTLNPVERIMTLAFADDRIFVETVACRRTPWQDLSNDYPFGPQEVIRGTGAVTYAQAPLLCQSWTSVLACAMEAASCRSRSLDGAAYYHRFALDGRTESVVWVNPHPPELRLQHDIIQAYGDLVTTTGLKDLYLGES